MTLEELTLACKALTPATVMAHHEIRYSSTGLVDSRWSVSVHDRTEPDGWNGCKLLVGLTPEEVLAKVTAYCQRDKPADAHADTERAP